MKKPFILDYIDGAQRLYGVVNELNHNYNIPFYMIETILQEALYEVKMQAKLEYDNAVQTYNQGNLGENQITLEEAAKNE